MPRHGKLLIIIADGEHARFVRPADDHALHTERTLDSASAHERSAELVSDRPGASFHSGSTTRHGVNPRHDPHVLAKEDFANVVARELDRAAAEGAFDQLVLVAPPKTLDAIRKGLHGPAASRVVGALPKDLTKTPDHELQPHLSEWVRPIHRAI